MEHLAPILVAHPSGTLPWVFLLQVLALSPLLQQVGEVQGQVEVDHHREDVVQTVGVVQDEVGVLLEDVVQEVVVEVLGQVDVVQDLEDVVQGQADVVQVQVEVVQGQEDVVHDLEDVVQGKAQLVVLVVRGAMA